MSTIYYRTKDGQADYGFSIERQSDGTYRPYITQQPSYRGQDEGAIKTHRLTDDYGRKYVCWDRALKTEPEAKTVAGMWADHTQQYIKTGSF